MATKPKYTKMSLGTLANGGQLVDNEKRALAFWKHFNSREMFLTDIGRINVYTIYISYSGQKYVFDVEDKPKKTRTFKANLKQASLHKGKIEFDVGVKHIYGPKGVFTIPISWFWKIPAFGGQGSNIKEGKTLNKGTQFEKDFYKDAVKVLEGETKGGGILGIGAGYIPTIIKMNKMFEKKLGQALGMVEADPKLVGVLEEGSANKSRPLAYSGNSIVVAAEGSLTEDMGSTLTDVTFQYGEDKTPVYLSLKYGPTLTFFNSGVRGRNGPTLFDENEIKQGTVTEPAGLVFLNMFGMADDQAAIKKFCESFTNYPRSQRIPNHIFTPTLSGDQRNAIEKLLRSGIGYGYWMVHNTKGTTIDYYEITKTYMEEASTIEGGVTIYYGRMDGFGKGINMTCSSKHYNFVFNIRNKQGGTFPTHVMCDYKKKKAGDIEERPQDGGADYEV